MRINKSHVIMVGDISTDVVELKFSKGDSKIICGVEITLITGDVVKLTAEKLIKGVATHNDKVLVSNELFGKLKLTLCDVEDL